MGGGGGKERIPMGEEDPSTPHKHKHAHTHKHRIMKPPKLLEREKEGRGNLNIIEGLNLFKVYYETPCIINVC
jgi:hypothetical protein